jgi:membrane protein implicated in regulation of membrane protease activity
MDNTMLDITTLWWILAGVTVAAELLTGTFYLLLIAIGMTFGAIAANLGWSIPAQLLSAAVTGVGLVLGWRLWQRFHPRSLTAKISTISNLDSGELLNVDAWSDSGRARALYRGACWDIELQPGQPMLPGPHRIVEIKGNRLIVTTI